MGNHRCGLCGKSKGFTLIELSRGEEAETEKNPSTLESKTIIINLGLIIPEAFELEN